MKAHEKILLIQKILIKCPPLIDDSVSLFPFIISVSEEYPNAEIFLLCEENCSFAFQFLPFKVRAFERPKEKLSTIETHHFCANLHDIFNIDLFFDLENSFNSSFIGFNFRARERIGYTTRWNKLFLTKKFVNPGPGRAEEISVKLLESYTGKNFHEMKISLFLNTSHEIEIIEKLFKEPIPPKFIMIMLDNFENTSKQFWMWKKFFSLFQNQKFIIWSQRDEELISEMFCQIELEDNNLYMHKGLNVKDMFYLLKKVKGVITNNVWAEGICTYLGIHSVSLFNQKINYFPEYNYFLFKPQRFIVPEEGLINYIYFDESRDFKEMNEVIDHLHFYFKL